MKVEQVVEIPEKDRSRSNQKLKIMYLYQILKENTDATHAITLQEIQDKLRLCDVTCERKSLYDDIEQLRKFGVEIEKTQANRTFSYKITNRQFELAELKLLVDTVQSAKFITEEKSNDLIKKIESYASKYEASQLHRQVYVTGRVKSMNEEIFKNVDVIHKAIAENMKIKFQYFSWNEKKEEVFRKGGAYYEISPWGLSWDDENYYMIGFDQEEEAIKHYRVDKMKNLSITIKKREGRNHFESINMAEYAKKRFAMFDGEEQHVKLYCENNMANVMIDRFGKDVHLLKADDEHFTINVKVAVSRHFLSWVFALGEGVKIIGPENVVQMVNDELDRMIRQYRN